MQPEEFVRRYQNSSAEEKKDALRKVLETQVKAQGDHLAWASLCEELSLLDCAFREVQCAVRDDPDNSQARFRLAQYLMEKGELSRAATHLEKALLLEPTHRESFEQLIEIYSLEGRTDRLEVLKEQAQLLGLHLTVSQETPLSGSEAAPDLPMPTEQEAVRFLYYFSGREDVYARQWCSQDGKSGYTPVRAPLTPKEAVNHFLGNVTLGVYPIRVDNTVKFMAVDLDIRKSALQNARTNPELAQEIRSQVKETAQKISQALLEYQLSAILEDSGYKGRHLWVLFETPQNAEFVFLFGKLFLAQITPLLPANLAAEFFPKQPSRSGKGLGNLIKLPLGIHRKTGRRSFFLGQEEQPVSDWVSLLATTPKASSQTLFQAIKKLKTRAIQSPQPSLEEDLSSSDAQKETLPPPPPVPPLWTEAHFETDPEIAHLLAHCPVLAKLKQRAEKHQTLSRDEKIVLIHSLGHSASGVQAVNYLFSLCANIPPESFLKSPLRGSPISCPRIRSRIPHITGKVDCSCPFDFAPESYPNPRLHLKRIAKTEENQHIPFPSLSTLAQNYILLLRKQDQIRSDLQSASKALCEQLKTLPEKKIAVQGGWLQLTERDGIEEIQFLPQSKEKHAL